MPGKFEISRMEDDDIYVKDGTVDIHKKPANKKKTGNWRACRFILGIDISFVLFFLLTFFANYHHI